MITLVKTQKDWFDEVKKAIELQSKAEDALAQFNEQLGELESMRLDIEAAIGDDLVEIHEEDNAFAACAHVLSKWEGLGVEAIQTEFDTDVDPTLEEAKTMPFPEFWPELKEDAADGQ